MRFLAQLSLGAAFLTMSIPTVAARIYPIDFLIYSRTPASTSSAPATPAPAPASQPFFFASEIPSGRLTRAQLVDAVATRLYTADEHDDCFGDLILSNNVDYDLLFADVSLDAPFATSICLGMRGGVAQGYSNGSFRPDRPVTVAEAAALFGDLGGLPLADSNHARRGAPWYERYMDALRAVDREFTMMPSDILTGAQLKHTLCVLKRYTPGLDPLGEFASGC